MSFKACDALIDKCLQLAVAFGLPSANLVKQSVCN